MTNCHLVTSVFIISLFKTQFCKNILIIGDKFSLVLNYFWVMIIIFIDFSLLIVILKFFFQILIQFFSFFYFFLSQDCFDWCLCSFNESYAGDHLMYQLAMNPDWKLAFNKVGQPVAVNKTQKRYLKCRHFTRIEIDDNHHHHHHKHHSKHHHHHDHNQQLYHEKTGQNKFIYAEDGICNDWEKSGEEIFDKAIHRDPRLSCILTHHPQYSRLALKKKSESKLKRIKLNINQTDNDNNNNYNNNDITEMALPKSNRCFNISSLLFDNSYHQSNNGQTMPWKRIRRLAKKVKHLCG